ncbi:MAG TPA: phosphoglucosamine mutase [Gemmatimonadales bacterium]|nr:phosphoglucosamine mutase [Gemmatimonadales bacterium]
MSNTLMVGVSGIRGIVGTDLTPENVARYAAAFGTWAVSGKREAGKGKRVRVVVGRDARTSGPMLQAAAVAGLQSVGVDIVDIGLTTTPTIQLAVEHHRAAGGIILTASHNPIEWNALKFVGADGIFLDTESGARVRDLAAQETLPRADWSAIGQVLEDDASIARHLDAILKLKVVDVPAIKKRKFRVALDCVRGAGGAIMPILLERLGCRVYSINLETDGRFPRPPEPIPANLTELAKLVRSKQADVGIAVDPDVDRLALVDEKGRAIGEDYTLAFAVRALLGKRKPGVGSRSLRGKVGPVVVNLSTSLVVDDAARDGGVEIMRAPVGEAHVARMILSTKSPIGGEGNGGVMYPALHAGRDAPLAAAMVLALLARVGRTVSDIVNAHPQYVIVKGKVPRGAALDRVYDALRSRFPDAGVNTDDGLRLAWSDRWLHVRPSNTEPIIRLIAEAPTGALAEQLVEEGRQICAAS